MTLTARPKIPSRGPNRSARSTLRACWRGKEKADPYTWARPGDTRCGQVSRVRNYFQPRSLSWRQILTQWKKKDLRQKKQLAQKNETNCGRSAARRSRRSTLVTSWFPDRSLGQLLVGGYRSSVQLKSPIEVSNELDPQIRLRAYA